MSQRRSPQPGKLRNPPMALGPVASTAMALSCLGWLLAAAPGLGAPPSKPPSRPPNHPQGPPQHLPIEARWCLAPGRCIELEVADDDREQTLGLQLRHPLPALRGMWFPNAEPTPVHFWMHRTPEPLDMLFVREGRVVAIEAGARPCMRLPCPSYGPDQPVDGVIELAAGQAEALGIGVGTAVPIERLPPNRGARSTAPWGPAPQ